MLNRLLSPLAGRWRRSLRGNPNLPDPKVLPVSLRVLLLFGTIRWVLAKTGMPLIERQVWSTAASILSIAVYVSMQMRSVSQGITGLLEKYPLVKYFPMPVRFFRLSAYSLDVEIFTNLTVSDLGRFLELQKQLYLKA